MKKPLVILGAGASFDYLSENEKKQIPKFLNFPLADEICYADYFNYLKSKIVNIEEMKYIIHPAVFKEIKEIFSGGERFIRNIASSLNRTQSLEQSVSDIWQKAKLNKSKERQRQLVGFAYYLQFLFYFLSKDFGGKTSNNYDELVNVISDFLNKDEESEILVINFNYDLLMDDALIGLDELTKDRLKYSKVHGSCDRCWISDPDFNNSIMRQYKLGSRAELIKNYSDDDFDGFFERGPEQHQLLEICKANSAKGKTYTIRPSLTLPFYNKDEYGFPCFKRDLEIIKNHLGVTDGVLIIGWSARDNELIKLMKDNIKEKIPLAAVAQDGEAVKEIKGRLSEIPFDDNSTCDYAGFTNFLISDKCEDFFNN